MANPYTQGLRYNYKPLDLSTIGKAALMNQGQYDQTQSALDEFDVAINALPQQEEWAKTEMGKYREKIDTLSEGLAQSRDPRASMRQLQKLNKEYKRRTGPGGDIAVVEGNVATYQDYKKRHQKMIADGKNVPANFNTFLSMQMEGFKGVDGEGNLQSLGLQDMTENMSGEIMDRAIELGKLSNADVRTALGKYASVGGFTKQAIDAKITTLDNTERAKYINEVLKNSPQYKPYLNQESRLIQYRNKGFDGEAAVGNQMATLDETKKSLEAQLAGKGLNDEQRSYMQTLLDQTNAASENLSKGVSQYGAMQYGQMMKSQGEIEKLTGYAAGTANLRNYTKEELKRENLKDDAGLARYRSDLRKKEYDYQNKFDLVQTPGGSNPLYADMTPDQVTNEIKQLNDDGSNPLKLRALRIYQDAANKKHHGNFMSKIPEGRLEELGLTEQDLIDGKMGKMQSMQDPEIQHILKEYSNGKASPTGVYTMDDNGDVYITEEYESSGYMSGSGSPISSSGGTKSRRTKVGTVSSAELKGINKRKARVVAQKQFVKDYASQKDAYFKEGNVTAFERYTPSTAKVSKTSAANFQNTMNWNEFKNSGIKQADFQAYKDAGNFKLDGVFHDPTLGTTIIQGTYGKDNEPFKLEPKYIQNDQGGQTFGSSVNNLLYDYTDKSGRSGQQLMNTIYGDIKYSNVVPMYESKSQTNYTKDLDFDRSAQELNPYLSEANQGKFALQSVGGTNGAVGTAVASKDANGDYVYLVKDSKTGNTVQIKADELKDVSSGGNTKYYVGSKTDALNMIR